MKGEMDRTRSWYPTGSGARKAPNNRNFATYSSAMWLRLCAVGDAGPRHTRRRFFLSRESGNLR